MNISSSFSSTTTSAFGSQPSPAFVSTIELMDDSMLSDSERVEKYCVSLCKELQRDYDTNSNVGRYNFKMELGRKYWKIHDGNGVHAFVDRNTGDVFKPASWKSPTKGVRYNLLDEYSRLSCLDKADWAGSYLYVRG